MKRLFAWIIVLLGIWLAVSPWFLNYAIFIAKIQDSLIGVALIGAALLAIYSKEKLTPNWPYFLHIALGVFLIISGAVIWGATSGASRLNDMIIGFLVLAISAIATQIIEGKKIIIHTKEGGELVDVTKITLKDGYIEMKGKAFGAMPQNMHLRADQIWIILGALPTSILLGIPKLLYRGWKANKRDPNKTQEKKEK